MNEEVVRVDVGILQSPAFLCELRWFFANHLGSSDSEATEVFPQTIRVVGAGFTSP